MWRTNGSNDVSARHLSISRPLIRSRTSSSFSNSNFSLFSDDETWETTTMSFLSFVRPALRLSTISRAPLSLRAPYSHLARSPLSLSPPTNPSQILAVVGALQQKRGAASNVGSRPGSQSFQHAKENVKEEVGDAARDWAKAIAGGNYPNDTVKPVNETFLAVTSAVASAVPKPYMVFGLLGGVPYIGSAATTCYLAREAGLATSGVITSIDPGVALTILDHALVFQTTYGAVMLSFLGALHWGMEFSGLGGHKGYSRLTLGAAPIVFAWSTLALDPTMALVAQWAGFTGLWYADMKATTAGWTPAWYSQYRFYLSILVGTCIISTLASISYWGPAAGHGLLSHDLELVRAQRTKNKPEAEGVVSGSIEAVSAGEAGDNYVMVRKHKEEEKGQEGEK
ncbi:hypothetical protein OF83DRAFT_748812 [Amylostereum chailletii]|nr:hypothetical protein OF83DRAFT_748812 [Amylostereum chailletii]